MRHHQLQRVPALHEVGPEAPQKRGQREVLAAAEQVQGKTAEVDREEIVQVLA